MSFQFLFIKALKKIYKKLLIGQKCSCNLSFNRCEWRDEILDMQKHNTYVGSEVKSSFVFNNLMVTLSQLFLTDDEK